MGLRSGANGERLDAGSVCRVLNGYLDALKHLADLQREGQVAEDRASIDTVLTKSRDLMKLIGDCGHEYR